MFRTELDRIPDTDGPGRARVFVRFGIIDTNFDGQAALFAQACVADATTLRSRTDEAGDPARGAGAVRRRPGTSCRSTSRPPEADRGRSEAGRPRSGAAAVHLTVHRDPVSGAESVALAAPAVRRRPGRTTSRRRRPTRPTALLAGAPTLEAVVALARNAMDGDVAADRRAARARARRGGRVPGGLRPLLLPERRRHAARGAGDLRPPVAHAVGRRAGSASRRTSPRNARAPAGCRRAERFSPDHPCAFLDVAGGRCTIYEVRPLACRGMNSLDAGECEKRLRDPAARAAFLAERRGRPFVHGADSRLPRGQRRPPAGRCPSCTASTCAPLDLIAALDLLLNGAEVDPRRLDRRRVALRIGARQRRDRRRRGCAR